MTNHHQQALYRVLEQRYSCDANRQHDENNGNENRSSEAKNWRHSSHCHPVMRDKLSAPTSIRRTIQAMRAGSTDNVKDRKSGSGWLKPFAKRMKTGRFTTSGCLCCTLGSNYCKCYCWTTWVIFIGIDDTECAYSQDHLHNEWSA